MRLSSSFPVFLACLPVLSQSRSAEPRCRSSPGSDLWPTAQEWVELNHTVGGRLHATIPLEAPCHRTLDEKGISVKTYDESRCAYITENQTSPSLHVFDPTSLFASPFGNASCTLTTNPEDKYVILSKSGFVFSADGRRCTLGFHPAYWVNVSSPQHIQSTIAFGKKHNVRLVIKNTGHDYIGKSTGANGLEIWTQNMKDMAFHERTTICGKRYSNVITAGAGVQAGEVLAFAKDHGSVLVSGQCSTVGWAGGYIQGGGQGPLLLRYGVAADSLLSVDVVTASGEFLTANACKNSDLFWAISGGGGGTFGVVTSVTAQAYPDATTSGAILNVTIPANATDMAPYWKAVEEYYKFSTSGVMEKGVYMLIYQDLPNQKLQVQPFIAYDMPLAQLKQLVAPFMETLEGLGLHYNITWHEFDNYYDSVDNLYVVNHGDYFIPGARFIPRDIVIQDPAGVANTMREINEAGISVHNFLLTPGIARKTPRTADNAVSPFWEDAHMHAELWLTIDLDITPAEMKAGIEKMTKVTNETLEKLAPGSGAYLNEANPGEPDWQRVFYGDKYPRLLEIKRKWDPGNVFWALTAVGSEVMTQDEYSGELCEV